MKLTLTVKDINNLITETVAIVPDFIAWERHTKRKVSDLSNGAGIEDMAFLAWSSMKRTGKTMLTFDEWVSELVEIEAGDDDPKATKKAR